MKRARIRDANRDISQPGGRPCDRYGYEDVVLNRTNRSRRKKRANFRIAKRHHQRFDKGTRSGAIDHLISNVGDFSLSISRPCGAETMPRLIIVSISKFA